jgi:hypothetical protein
MWNSSSGRQTLRAPCTLRRRSVATTASPTSPTFRMFTVVIWSSGTGVVASYVPSHRLTGRRTTGPAVPTQKLKAWHRAGSYLFGLNSA